jgi:hypothetical protein
MPTVKLVREYRKLESRLRELRGARQRAAEALLHRIMQELEKRAADAAKREGASPQGVHADA